MIGQLRVKCAAVCRVIEGRSCFILMKKRSWKYDDFERVEDSQHRVRCKYCRQAYSHRTNAYRHDCAQRPQLAPPKETTPRIVSAIQQGSIESAEQVASHFLRYAVIHSVPFSSMDDPHLRRYWTGIRDPRYAVITSRAYKTSLLETSERELNNLAVRAKQTVSSFSCDTWTSPAGLNLLLLLAHSAQGTTDVVALIPLGASKSAEVLANHIETAWGRLEAPKYHAMISDNENTMIAVARKLKVTRVGCAAHILQLGVQDTLRERNLRELSAYINRVASHFRQPQAWCILKDSCIRLGTRPLRPRLSCPTRWNSFQLAAARLLHLAPAIRACAGGKHPDLPAEVVTTIHSVTVALSAAERATRTASVAHLCVGDAVRWFRDLTVAMEVVVPVDDGSDSDKEADASDSDKQADDGDHQSLPSTRASGEDDEEDEDFADDGAGKAGVGGAAAAAPLISVDEFRSSVGAAIARRFRPWQEMYRAAALVAPGSLRCLLDVPSSRYHEEHRKLADLIEDEIQKPKPDAAGAAQPAPPPADAADVAVAAPAAPSVEDRVRRLDLARQSVGARFVSYAVAAPEATAAAFWTPERQSLFPDVYTALARYVLATPMTSVTAERCFSILKRTWSPHRTRIHTKVGEAMLRVRLAISRDPDLPFVLRNERKRGSPADEPHAEIERMAAEPHELG
jgi:hypothetical protein